MNNESDYLITEKYDEIEFTPLKKKKCTNCKEVLIVDDEIFNIIAIEINLKKANVESERALNGKFAIDLILEKYTNKRTCKSHCPGLKMILMDYQMPVMDGIETAKKIQELKSKNIIEDIPIIACTAFGAKEHIDKCYKVGMKDFVNKPISYQMINDLLDKYLF